MLKCQNNDGTALWLESLCTALREQRERLGLSAKQVASMLSISVNTLKSMESGAGGVALQTWVRAWQLFGVMPGIAKASRTTELGAVVAIQAVAMQMSRSPTIRRESPPPCGPSVNIGELSGIRVI